MKGVVVMKYRAKLLAAMGGVLVLSVVMTGCILLIGAGAGAGAIAYIKGESIRTYNHPMMDVAAASQGAFSDLGVSASETSVTELESTFVGTMSDQAKVVIKLRSKGDKITEARVRVGRMGNETASQRIHDRILKNLE